jgi:hypothetical protein
MFGQNKFLMEHMKRQATLIHEEQEKKDAKKKSSKKSKHGTANGEPAFGELSIATIISEMPPKKDVLDYFKDRVAKLVAEKMEEE